MAKFKLGLEDLNNSINCAFGLISQKSALNLCYSLNLELEGHKLTRLKEDLYSDHKGLRYLYRNWGFYDELREHEIKFVENRSYKSIGKQASQGALFEDELILEKNWLPNKEGYNFFLWFEGNIEVVKFTLRWEERLAACSGIHKANRLSDKSLERLNKSIKYYNDRKQS